MRRIQQRRPRRRSEPETVLDLPRKPAADTSTARDLLAEVDRVLTD